MRSERAISSLRLGCDREHMPLCVTAERDATPGLGAAACVRLCPCREPRTSRDAPRNSVMADVAKVAGVSNQTISAWSTGRGTSPRAPASVCSPPCASSTTPTRRPCAGHRPLARRGCDRDGGRRFRAGLDPARLRARRPRPRLSHDHLEAPEPRSPRGDRGHRRAQAPPRRGDRPAHRSPAGPAGRDPVQRAPPRRSRWWISSAAAMWTAAVDQFAGAERATRLPLELGHRSIAHVAGSAGFDAGPPAPGRLALRAHRRRDRRLDPALEGDWSARSGLRARPRIAADEDRDGDLRQRRDGHRACARSTSPDDAYPPTSAASSASMTSPKPAISTPSRLSARTSTK